MGEKGTADGGEKEMYSELQKMSEKEISSNLD